MGSENHPELPHPDPTRFYCSSPASPILYSNVPLPRERRSSKPNFDNLLKYVQADRFGMNKGKRQLSTRLTH